MNKKELIGRLTSRRFWLTVAALITLAANEQWTEFVTALLGFVGFESATNVVKAAKSQ